MLAIGPRWLEGDEEAETDDITAAAVHQAHRPKPEWARAPARPPMIDLTSAVDEEKHEFMEVYSPPRVAPVLRRRRHGAYLSIDIETGYDLSRFEVRRSVIQLL